jgi:ribosomal protein S21
VLDGLNLDRALKSLKEQSSGILRELKRREHFVPRNQRRRLKARRARKLLAKASPPARRDD